ncbi:predicted protein [Postia placenta Mad-698-R]|uniref:F-box domain-containing protein n=1 Tax=Postia placenta MAD-698-R-SB12 TaxID=670580 RepID=A0A1X6MZU2_9APHY|nr:hypothetical protein POSPLADRAFT_1145654 [Postia placenta MAD-698-R-SB12]EED83882.1 predicted protein [Postia placenta Mad-698-R]OSX61762.1 hypothetical protein POSPLADRAFT_1145654 [Postia placenta MAD-698-R-SB12]
MDLALNWYNLGKATKETKTQARASHATAPSALGFQSTDAAKYWLSVGRGAQVWLEPQAATSVTSVSITTNFKSQLINIADIRFTLSEAASLLEKLSNSCREWSLTDLKCIEDELLHTLSNVRMLVNAQHPVNRLPVEIHGEIFHQVPPPLTTNLEDPSLEELLVWDSLFDFKDTDALLPLTHVCRRWRDVALDTPTLWTTIYGSSHPDAISEYRIRSQSAPLRVLNVEDEDLDVEQLWRTDGQRIQSLASYTGRDSDLPASYAHGLQALAAWDCQFQGDVSNVKVLVLRAVDWHLPSSLTNLTHFYFAQKRLHAVDLFHILSIAPRLEDLGLDKIIAEDAFDPHENIPAVTLHHLRRLAICCPDRNMVSGFFSHVGLPARLAVNFERCKVSDFQWLVPLTQIDAKSLYISAWTHSVVAAGSSKAVRFSNYHDFGRMDRWITALLSHFHLNDLWIASTNKEDEAISGRIRMSRGTRHGP